MSASYSLEMRRAFCGILPRREANIINAGWYGDKSKITPPRLKRNASSGAALRADLEAAGIVGPRS